MDADGVLDLIWIPRAQVEAGVKITDCALAITSKRKRVGHESCTILTEIESVLSGMREIRTSVRDDHLCDRHTPEYWAHVAMIVICDIAQYNTFTVVEANVELLLSDMTKEMEVP